jgi:hypothetical protein
MAVTRRSSSSFSLTKPIGVLGALCCAGGVYIFVRQILVTFDTGLWSPIPLRVLLTPAILDVAHFPPPGVPSAGDGILDQVLGLPASGSLIALGVVLTVAAMIGGVARKIGEERRNLRAHYDRKGRR